MAANRKTPNPTTHPSDIAGDAYAIDVAEEIAALWGRSADVLSSVAGTNTITANAGVTLEAYTAPVAFWLIPANTNTGAVTINIDGLGAKNIVDSFGAALGEGSLQALGMYLIAYDGTAFRLLNAPNVGNWTPGLTFGNASVGMSKTGSGGYSADGPIVNIWGNLVLTAKGSSTGTARLTGLPFAIGNNLGTRGAGSIGFFSAGALLTSTPVLGWDGGASTMFFRQGGTGGTSDLTHANFGNTTEVQFAATYSRY